MAYKSSQEVQDRATELIKDGVPDADVKRFIKAAYADLGPAGEEARKLQEVSRSRPRGLDDTGGVTPSGMVVDLALEAGLPAAAQALTSPAAPTGLTSAVGAFSALTGNLIAQSRRVFMGEQEKYSGGQMAEAAALGAVPFLGPAKAASKLASAGRYAANIGVAAGAGVAGAEIRSLIDEGENIGMDDAVTAAGLPALFTAGLGPIGLLGKKMLKSGTAVGEANARFSEAGVKPTAGLLKPEDFAFTESRIARMKPTGNVAQSVDEAYDQLATGLINVAPNPQEPAAIFEQISPLLRKTDSAKKQLDKLDDAAKQARADANSAYEKYQVAVASGDEAAMKSAYQEAQESSNKEFKTNFDSILKNARTMAMDKVVNGGVGMDPATARTLTSEHIAKPLMAAIDNQAARLYEPIDNLAQVFDTAPILARAEEAAKQISGTKELPPKLSSAISLVRENLGEGMVSLQSLRNVRDDLYRRIRLKSYESNAEEAMIKKVAGEITEQINSQAVPAMERAVPGRGQELGEQLLQANQFYREKSELFDKPGIELLFGDNPKDEIISTMMAGIKKSGANSDEYRNLQNLIVKVGEFSPEMGGVLKDNLNSIIRGSILQEASTISSETGQRIVDGAQLMKIMGTIESANPGTLKRFGLGDGDRVAELGKLFDKYDAVKMDEGQWDSLFSSSAFKSASAGRLAVQLKPVLAAAQAENLLVRSAQLRHAGKIDLANTRYKDAINTLAEVDGDLLKAKNLHDLLLNDPVAKAFNNPNLGDTDFNSFERSFLEAKAGKIVNADVGEIVSALRASPEKANQDLLLRLQERYIADHIATFRTSRSTPDDVKGMADFFNPANKTDAANEIARAKKILDPEQYKALEEFAVVANDFLRYERLAAAPKWAASHDIPAYQIIRRSIDAVADLWRNGQYALAARQLANPGKYAENAVSRGKTLGAIAGQPGKTAALQVAKDDADAPPPAADEAKKPNRKKVSIK